MATEKIKVQNQIQNSLKNHEIPQETGKSVKLKNIPKWQRRKKKSRYKIFNFFVDMEICDVLVILPLETWKNAV
jgi:hypothetical protein